jgi:hypothetical protein
MQNNFTGQRFLIIESTDLGESVIAEYDVGAGQEEQMRKNLEAYVCSLKQMNPSKEYYLKLDNESSDETQQIEP